MTPCTPCVDSKTPPCVCGVVCGVVCVDAGPEQSGEDSDCDGPDRVAREWRSVQRDDGVACSGYGESVS